MKSLLIITVCAIWFGAATALNRRSSFISGTHTSCSKHHVLIQHGLQQRGTLPQQGLVQPQRNIVALRAYDSSYTAELDPSIGALTVIILGSSLLIQRKLSRNALLQEEILNMEREIKRMKLKLPDSLIATDPKYQNLQRELQKVRKLELESRTFISIPGLTLRFRVPNRISSNGDIDLTTAGGDKAPGGDNIASAASELLQRGVQYDAGGEPESYSVRNGESSSSGNRNVAAAAEVEAPQLVQDLLVFVGVGVIVVLVYLLMLLSVDPVNTDNFSSRF